MSGYGGKAITSPSSNYGRSAVTTNETGGSGAADSPGERKPLNLAPRSANPVQRSTSTSQVIFNFN